MERDTVGKLSYDLLVKQDDDTHTADEQASEQLTEYMAEVMKCVATHESVFPVDFYVVVITKRERLLKNVLRNYFFATLACPTPTWDQAVFYYKRHSSELQFLWQVPDKFTCYMMQSNPLSVPSEERELLEDVLDFHSGELFNMAKRLNGEEADSPMLIERN